MLVKIHDLNSNDKIDRKDAYKAPNGFYYSSEAAYQAVVKNEEMRKKCIEYMYDFMLYDSYMKMPTIFYKKLKDWSTYGYEVVYTAMALADMDVRSASIYKTFENENSRVAYLSAIIQNRLNDALKIEKRKTEKPKTVNIEIDNLEDVGCSPRTSMGVGNLLGDM